MSEEKGIRRVNSDLFVELTHDEADDKADLDPTEYKAWALCDRLSEILPFDSDTLAGLMPGVRELLEGLPRLQGESLRDLVRNPKSRLQDLRAAKDHAKRIGKQVETPAEREAARVVYYAAIAAAIVFHDENISQHTHSQLQGYLGSLLEVQWIIPELRDLFARAHEACAKRGHTTPEDGKDHLSS